MTDILKALSICALALPVVLLAAPAKAEMTGDQIKSAVSGKTFSFTGKYNGTMKLGADGAASMTLRVGVTKTGKWFINGNQFCSQWEGEGEQCGTWTDAGGKYTTSNGYTMTPE